MSLVNYSSSSSSSSSLSSDSSSSNDDESQQDREEYETVPIKKIIIEKKHHHNLSTKKLLPLPNAIKNLSNRSIHNKPIDNPNEHDGRKRSFEHERGNWASYAYVAIDTYIIEDIQESLKDYFKSNIELKFSNDIHISLTKTIVLHYHWIESFVKSVQNKLNPINEFLIELKNLKIYCNDDKTRTFIGLQVLDMYTNNLKIIMEIFNEILNEYRLEKFYEDPSFHASIVWCLGDQKQLFVKHLDCMQKIIDDFYLKDVQSFRINVRSIYCKIGNKLFTFKLNKK